MLKKSASDKQTAKELKKSASDKRTAVKATSELQKSAIGFSSIVLDKTKSEKEQKRTLPSAHKAWLLRTRTLGGFVVVSLCDAWGLPQFSNMLDWLKTMIEDLYALLCMMYSIKKEVTCICCMYKIFVCTKFYVQIIFVCTKKYFTWYFKNLLLLCLDSSKNLWIAFLKQGEEFLTSKGKHSK